MSAPQRIRTCEDRILDGEKCLQHIPSLRRDAPATIEAASEAAWISPEVSGDLGEASAQAPLLGLDTLS